VRAHVGDRCGLPCRSGGSGRCGGAHLTCGGAAGEPAADRLCDVKLATAEGSRSLDGTAWAGIARSFRLEQSERSFHAVSRPDSDDSSFGFAERLR
jgi:hypothetical protein